MTAGSAAATVISVNNSTGQVANFTSIQAAVNAANPGDEIIVKPGIYEENIAINKTYIYCFRIRKFLQYYSPGSQ